MLLKFKIDLYPKIVLLKSAFSFTDRAYVHLDEREGYYFVELTPKEAAAPFDDREFINEMLFQTVRQEVSRKTKTIRELTLARAFSSTIISEEYPESMDEDEGVDIDSILSDWFENNE